jgi:hypothetical protein
MNTFESCIVFEMALKFNLDHVLCRDSFGGGTLVGDMRWAGAYGIQADFVALSHCSIEIIKTTDIQVMVLFCFTFLSLKDITT